MSVKMIYGTCLVLIINCMFATSALAERTCSEKSGIDNRGIETAVFKKNVDGDIILQVKTHVSLGKRREGGLNLSFDLYAAVNGIPSGYVPEDIVFNGAITCAVTCSGKCPSIFGDGVCASCNCSYSDWISIPIGGLRDGDLVEIELRPARGGAKESNTKDDVLQIKFDEKTMM